MKLIGSMIRYLTITALASFLFGLTLGCSDKRRGHDDQAPSSTSTDKGEGGEGDDDNSNKNPPVFGTLNIGTISAFAISENSPLNLNLLQRTVKSLSAIGLDGSIESVKLPDTDDWQYEENSDDQPEVRDILSLGKWGTLIQFDDFKYHRHTNALWITKDGSLKPFATADATPKSQFEFQMVQLDLDDNIWIAANDTLYKFNPEDETFTRYLDGDLYLSQFTITADNSLYMFGFIGGDTNHTYLRRLKSSGGMEEMPVVNHWGSGSSFGRFMFYGNRFHEVKDDVVEYSFLPVDTGKKPVIGDKWLFGWQAQSASNQPYPRAINISSREVAGNPVSLIMPSQQTNYPRFSYTGTAFDGTNLVDLSWQSNELAVDFHAPVKHRGTPGFNIRRLFGPLQGFTDKWAAYATIPGDDSSYWYVTIDPLTGMVETDSRKLIEAPADVTSNLLEYTTLYKLGTHIVMILGNSSPYLVADFDASGHTALVTQASTANLASSADTYGHDQGVVVNDKLYLPEGSGVLERDKDGNETLRTIPLLTEESSDPGCLRYFLSLMPIDSDATAPALLMRPCGQFAQVGAQAQLMVFSDWTFATRTSNIAIAADQNATKDVSYSTGSRARLLTDSAGHFLVNVPSLDKIYIYEYDQTNGLSSVSTQTASTLKLENNRPVASQFRQASELAHVNYWSGLAFLAAGKATDQTYRSFHIDLSDDREEELTDLEGVQIYTSAIDRKNTFLISGTRVSTNTSVLYRYDIDGTLLDANEESNVKLIKMAPIASSDD